MEAIKHFVLNVTVGQIIGAIVVIVAVISGMVEFSDKIQKWPITKVLSWIGSRTNKELYDRIGDLEKKVDELAKKQNEAEEKAEERAAINCRVRILQFSDELRQHTRHSEESFNQVFEDIDVYEKYCKAHPNFTNNRTVRAKERIKAAHDDCMDKNNFL